MLLASGLQRLARSCVLEAIPEPEFVRPAGLVSAGIGTGVSLFTGLTPGSA
jgi:hypothetical protein